MDATKGPTRSSTPQPMQRTTVCVRKIMERRANNAESHRGQTCFGVGRPLDQQHFAVVAKCVHRRLTAKEQGEYGQRAKTQHQILQPAKGKTDYGTNNNSKQTTRRHYSFSLRRSHKRTVPSSLAVARQFEWKGLNDTALIACVCAVIPCAGCICVNKTRSEKLERTRTQIHQSAHRAASEGRQRAHVPHTEALVVAHRGEDAAVGGAEVHVLRLKLFNSFWIWHGPDLNTSNTDKSQTAKNDD